MMTLKEFAVPFGLLTLALWVWLFRTHWPVLMIFSLTSVVAMIALHRNEEIVQMVVEPKRVLFEMQRIEKNVFAKVDEVRRLAEQLGELTAFNINQLWRFAPQDPEAVRLQERDRLAGMLKDMGIIESRVQEITSKITDMITLDLVRHVWSAVPPQIFSEGRAKGMDQAIVRKQLTDTLMNAPVGQAQQAAKAYLEPFGGWTDKVQTEIARFEEFRRKGTLRKREM